MPDLRGLLADPEFNALPIGRRTSILNKINPALADEYAQSHGGLDFPGKESSMSAGQPQSWWDRGWDSARQAIFGSPDRAEAKAVGLGLQPTPADLAEAGMAAASFAGGPMAGAAALRHVPGVVGKVGSFAASHPRMVNAALGALGGEVQGGDTGAVVGAAAGAVLGGRLSPNDVLKKAKDLVTSGKGAEARALIEALRQQGPGRVAAAAPTGAAKVAPAVVDKGRAAAASHGNLMAFAKDIASKNPKAGEKIWILLDEAGQPVKQLTSDQAGAAARKGLKTTWVRNLWR
jgi:hypothetical protein